MEMNLFAIDAIIQHIKSERFYTVDSYSETELGAIVNGEKVPSVKLLGYGKSTYSIIPTKDLVDYRLASPKEAKIGLLESERKDKEMELSDRHEQLTELRVKADTVKEADELKSLNRQINRTNLRIITLSDELYAINAELVELQDRPVVLNPIDQEVKEIDHNVVAEPSVVEVAPVVVDTVASNIKKIEEEVVMKKNNYTVDIREGQPVVIVNKSGKEYSADAGKGLTDLMDMVKGLEVQVTDVTAKYEASKEWFRANIGKAESGEYVMLNHKAPEKTTVKEADRDSSEVMAEAINFKGGIDYHTKKIDKSKLQSINLLSECGIKGIDPWSGREVSDRVIDYLRRNQAKLPVCFHGICIDYENQQRIRCGQPLVSKKEVAEKRRRGIFAAQKAQAEAKDKSAQTPTPVNDGQPLF